MSRFFNQNQQSQPHYDEKVPSPVADIEEVLETIRESADTQLSGIDGAVRNSSVDHLLDIAKKLDHPTDAPLETEHVRRKVRAMHACNRILTSKHNEDGLGIEAYRSLRTRLMRLLTLQGFGSLVVSSAVQGE